MTHSPYPELQSSAFRAEPEAAQPTGIGRTAADFLTELSVSLHRRAMYPPGHPHLHSAIDRLVSKADALLRDEPEVVFGVGRDQLVVNGAATDTRNNVHRDLAERLHRHRLATVRLSRGLTAPELDHLVALLSAEPSKASRTVNLVAETAGLEHVELKAIEYERIVLEEIEAGGESGRGSAPRRDDLWVDLARLAAESSPGSLTSSEGEPLVLARTIDCGSADAGYNRQILGRLTQLAEELAEKGSSRDQALHGRLSKLLASLRPGTLARLLTSTNDEAERRRFVTAASSTLDIEAVMRVLEATAAASNQEVSHHLLRLLRKMGQIGPGAPAETRAAADAALQVNVHQLLEDWRLEDPNPETYTTTLDTMAVANGLGGARTESCDPLAILQIALEAGVSGPRTELAVDDALAAGRLQQVIALLTNAPDPAATDVIWRKVATPARLRYELRAGALGSESTAAIIERLGDHAVDPLLETLAATDSRAMRAIALRILSGLGDAASSRAVAILPGSPWYVQRNLFVLLGRLGPWPAELPTHPYLTNSDARVRREAVKLTLESPGRREAGLAAGLVDADEAIRSLTLTSALEGCPANLLRKVRIIVADAGSNPETRALAIRVIARSGDPETVSMLVDFALAKKLRFLRRRIAAKSPEVLAAVAGLAGHWGQDPRAVDVLNRARRHRDVEIRGAAEGAS